MKSLEEIKEEIRQKGKQPRETTSRTTTIRKGVNSILPEIKNMGLKDIINYMEAAFKRGADDLECEVDDLKLCMLGSHLTFFECEKYNGRKETDKQFEKRINEMADWEFKKQITKQIIDEQIEEAKQKRIKELEKELQQLK